MFHFSVLFLFLSCGYLFWCVEKRHHRSTKMWKPPSGETLELEQKGEVGDCARS